MVSNNIKRLSRNSRRRARARRTQSRTNPSATVSERQRASVNVSPWGRRRMTLGELTNLSSNAKEQL